MTQNFFRSEDGPESKREGGFKKTRENGKAMKGAKEGALIGELLVPNCFVEKKRTKGDTSGVDPSNQRRGEKG